MTPSDEHKSDDSKISEDRREALRYALAIGSGAATRLLACKPGLGAVGGRQHAGSHPRDQGAAHRGAAGRTALLQQGPRVPAPGPACRSTWPTTSPSCSTSSSNILKSTYGNSILDLQSDKIDLGFALNPTPQRALVVDFTFAVFPHPFGAMLKKGLEAKTWADINKPDVNIAVDVGSANETVARRFAPNATIKSLKSRDEVMLEMASGRVDCVVNALVLGLTAIAKNPNLGTYKILQIALGRRSRAAWRCGASPTSAGAISSRCGSTTTAASARCANGSSRDWRFPA